MTKKVNIYPRGPITGVNPPIRIPVKNVTKDVKDIRRCIMAGAKVEEITKNGIVVLNLQNYDLDNGGAAEEKVPKFVENASEAIKVKTELTEAGQKIKDDAEEVKKSEEHIEKIIEMQAEDTKAREEKEEALRNTPVIDNDIEYANVVEAKVVEETEEVPEKVEVPVEKTEENPRDGLTKRQRRALRRAEELRKAAESKEIVETKDPEADAENA